ncbi:hypothetical protein GGX14DRAFT_702113 [Mycena pura]|uniref:Uncharacterized protein n=1 Tax=Mycena pura TaxID=153505 RepID=A0AAD6UJL3_9AGAR|nr:hypothetical protein GGX14DRAFT_702113 [Mycena pura]
MSSFFTRSPSRGSIVCAPVDNAGTALLNSTIDAGGDHLFCNYPVAGECEYFANNGGFSGGSDKLCPDVKASSSSTAACAPADNAGTALLNSTIDARGDYLFCNYPVAGECEYFANNGGFSAGSDKLCPDVEASSSTAACASVDNASTALLNSTIDAKGEFLFCNYPVAGECEYFANNGGLSSGSNRLCPEALPNVKNAATHKSISVSITKGISARVVAGISVTLAVLFITIFILMTMWVRRRLGRRATKQRALSNTISPFSMVHFPANPIPNVANSLEVRSISAGSLTRQQLESELLNAQEKMVKLERIAVPSGGATPGYARSRLRLAFTRGVSSGGGTWSRGVPAGGRASPDLIAQLQEAREQIDMLVTRIHALEANADPWGIGMSDQPPPEYV